MKRIGCVLFGFVVFCCFFCPAAIADEEVCVNIRATKIRVSPAYWSSWVETVKEGDCLEVLKKEGAWLKVRSDEGNIGYLELSAVTRRETTPEADQPILSSDTLSGDTPVMAGKGWGQ